MRLIGLAVILAASLALAPIATEAQRAGRVDSGHEWRSTISLPTLAPTSGRLAATGIIG